MTWNGACSICHQPVEMVRVGPDSPCRYSHIAKPHTRTVTWYRISDHDLFDLLAYRESW